MKVWDVIVIGAGLIGSAAAKYLSAARLETLLLGPEEGNEEGLHASHYDEARVTRTLATNPVWSNLARLAIDRYAEIENASGISFHDPCGHLRGDLPSHCAGSQCRNVERTIQEVSVPAVRWGGETIKRRFPYLEFAPDVVFHWEGGPAGIINPRRLIGAQIALGKQSGLTLIREGVRRTERRDDTFVVTTGVNQYRCRRLLACTGASTNILDVLPFKLDLRIETETVFLCKVDQSHAQMLTGMPGIIWCFDDHPVVTSAYVLPPVRYPDGNLYLKIGADHDRDVSATTLSEYDVFMRSSGSAQTGKMLKELLWKLLPSLTGAPFITKPCLLAYTPGGYPAIDKIAPNCFVAVGGNGQAAKSSDQIGLMAAQLVLDELWHSAFHRDSFRATPTTQTAR